MPRCRIICSLFFIIISLYGCATRTAMLPAREQVGESATPVMVALESYRGDAQFFIKYRSENKFYIRVGTGRTGSN